MELSALSPCKPKASSGPRLWKMRWLHFGAFLHFPLASRKPLLTCISSLYLYFYLLREVFCASLSSSRVHSSDPSRCVCHLRHSLFNWIKSLATHAGHKDQKFLFTETFQQIIYKTYLIPCIPFQLILDPWVEMFAGHHLPCRLTEEVGHASARRPLTHLLVLSLRLSDPGVSPNLRRLIDGVDREGI